MSTIKHSVSASALLAAMTFGLADVGHAKSAPQSVAPSRPAVAMPAARPITVPSIARPPVPMPKPAVPVMMPPVFAPPVAKALPVPMPKPAVPVMKPPVFAPPVVKAPPIPMPKPAVPVMKPPVFAPPVVKAPPIPMPKPAVPVMKPPVFAPPVAKAPPIPMPKPTLALPAPKTGVGSTLPQPAQVAVPAKPAVALPAPKTGVGSVMPQPQAAKKPAPLSVNQRLETAATTSSVGLDAAGKAIDLKGRTEAAKVITNGPNARMPSKVEKAYQVLTSDNPQGVIKSPNAKSGKILREIAPIVRSTGVAANMIEPGLGAIQGFVQTPRSADGITKTVNTVAGAVKQLDDLGVGFSTALGVEKGAIAVGASLPLPPQGKLATAAASAFVAAPASIGAGVAASKAYDGGSTDRTFDRGIDQMARAVDTKVHHVVDRAPVAAKLGWAETKADVKAVAQSAKTAVGNAKQAVTAKAKAATTTAKVEVKQAAAKASTIAKIGWAETKADVKAVAHSAKTAAVNAKQAVSTSAKTAATKTKQAATTAVNKTKAAYSASKAWVAGLFLTKK